MYESDESRLGQDTSKVVNLVAEAAGKLFNQWGYRKILGETWAVLFLSPDKLDSAAIRRTLNVSSGALSMALRDLIRLGLAYRETPDSGRRLCYRAESDIWLVITRIFREQERERLGAILKQIENAERLVRAGMREAQNEEEKFRLDQIKRLIGVGRFAMNLLDAFMERTKVELKAAQKWLSVSGKLGGEPLSRLRRAINASRADRRRP